MPISEARRRANDKYNAKAYDQIQFRVKKGRKAELQAHAAAQGESLNAFLLRAIEETMCRDSAGKP
ncbi:MAG: hypothetical protein Q4C72_05720 [Eubacteriales bacterium]|nr:hypothetical protein [Eubacteriales bacterium]